MLGECTTLARSLRSAPDRTILNQPAISPSSPAGTRAHGAPPDEANLRTAFRELHGARLHGFALLMTLGDRRLAAQLAADSLAAGARRVGMLRHPERAAAWLRARVARRAAGVGRSPGAAAELARRGAVEALGVEPAALAGLGSLQPRERAALIAASIERLDIRDVATILDTDGRRPARLVTRARRRYANAFAAAWEESDAPDNGPIARRVKSAADRGLR